MKDRLLEEIQRILEIQNYGKKSLNEQGDFLSKLFGSNKKEKELPKEDDPKKADLISSDVKDFFKTLEDASNSGGISQQKKGSMTYQKSVEAIQIGLMILGYNLPAYGVDGLFGPETASAVKKFKDEHLKSEIKEAVSLVSAGGNIIGNPGEGTHNAEDWASRNAWDVAAPEGTTVYSISSGTVRRVRQGTGQLIKSGVKKIYGDQISISSNDGKPDVFYTHIETDLKEGDTVKVGDVIGKIMKYEGIPTHVHIGLSRGNLSDYTNLTGTKSGSYDDSDQDMAVATPEMIKKMIDLLDDKDIKSEDLKKYLDKPKANYGGMISTSGDWVEITKNLLRKYEGFSPTAKWDENAYRGGYGTDKKIVNGTLTTASKDTTWSQKEAEDTLEYEIRNDYGPKVANQLGVENWEKLNDKQKAALVSLGYNAGPYIFKVRDYGRGIKQAIENDDLETAGQLIKKGPTTGSSSGKYYSGLAKRRSEESDLFLS